MRVSVCINTYHRPAELVDLLYDLAAQVGEPKVAEVVVTDNDAAGSARSSVEPLIGQMPYRLIYQIEPVQNIALTRNRGIHRASGDWIGFLDDDERVRPDWLALMAAQARVSNADGVFSVVLQDMPATLPNWLPNWLADQGASIHGHRRYTSGEVMPANQLFSGNVLIRKSTLLMRDGPFDAAYGLSGGEDADLFNALRLKGAHFVWCDEAWASEKLPAERLTQAWFLRRRRRGAQDYALQVLGGVFGPVTATTRLSLWVDSLFKLMTAMAGYLVLSLPGADPAKRFDWRRKVEAQLGKIDVLVGRRRILEYKQPGPE